MRSSPAHLYQIIFISSDKFNGYSFKSQLLFDKPLRIRKTSEVIRMKYIFGKERKDLTFELYFIILFSYDLLKLTDQTTYLKLLFH